MKSLKLIGLLAALNLSAGLSWAEYLPLRTDVTSDVPQSVVLKQDSREVQLEIKVPGVELIQGTLDGTTWDRVQILGGGYELDLGCPEVPHFTRLLIIPATAAVHATFQALETHTIPNVHLMPAQGDEPNDSSPLTPLNKAPVKYDQTVYQTNALYPAQRVMVGEPAIMRGLRVVTLRANPVQYNPVTHELVVTTKFRVNVSFEGQDLRNVPTQQVPMSSSWANMVRATSFNAEDNLTDEQNTGSYLIVCPQNTILLADIAPLIDWKKRKGHSVTVSTFTTNSSTVIKGLIQTAYNSWKPEYVLLFGDVSGSYALAPGYSSYSTDHPYSQLDGSDILADVALGRLPAETQLQSQVMVNKGLFYEKMPFIDNTAWFSAGSLCANYGQSLSMIQTSRWIKDRWLKAGYTRIDTLFVGGDVPTFMRNSINAGVTYINYRGWISMQGFGTDDIDMLTNGRKLCFPTILTCGTGGFGSSVMEYFVKVGTQTTPKGAVGCIGIATSATEPPQNNCLNYGIYAGLFEEGLTQAGTALTRGKLELYNAYNQNSPGTVANYSNWCALAGDPGLELFTGPIQFMLCTIPDQITYGVTSLPLTVTRHAGGVVEGATVCCYKSGVLQTIGTTDANGQVTMSLAGVTQGTGLDNVKVTITKHNYYPIVDSVDVVNSAVAVGYFSYTVDDDNLGGTSGDGDAIINPGETVDLPLTFKNYGTSITATGISTTVSETDPYTTLSNATQSFPDMAPGATGTSAGAIRLAIASSCPSDHVFPFTFNTTSNQGSWPGTLNLVISSYDLALLNAQFTGSDTLLSPSETANLTLTVKNTGHKTANNLAATLVSLDPLVTVNDNSAVFGTVNIGATANCGGNPFNLTASSTAMRGHWANLQVTYNANGATIVDTFQVKLGTKLITDPQGPDAYGYYCYDNGDVGYPQAPIYSWVEIDPGYGGSGSWLPLTDNGEDQDQSTNVTLPFTFRYYGENITQITVCTNGWLSMIANSSYNDFRNYQIPSAIGPSGMAAPFWDDLMTGSGHVCSWNDATNHRFIVEWSRVRLAVYTNQQIFQVILYDPAYYATPTGDGEIVFQYNAIADLGGTFQWYYDNPYSTAGLESPDQRDGIQMVYMNYYGDPAAAHLQNSLAYKFTTAFGSVAQNLSITMTPVNPPIVIPANGGSFNFNAVVTNNGPSQSPFWVWARDRNPDGTYTSNLLGPVQINPLVGVTVSRQRTQVVAFTWPPGLHWYVGYANSIVAYPAADADSFSWTKSTTADGGPEITQALCFGELFPGETPMVDQLPTAFGLGEARPNPFNPTTAISYQLPLNNHVSLKVYDVSGRMVAKLVDSQQQAGSHQVSFDGSRLASGLYFVRMQAGSFNAVKKMMLVK